MEYVRMIFRLETGKDVFGRLFFSKALGFSKFLLLFSLGNKLKCSFLSFPLAIAQNRRYITYEK